VKENAEKLILEGNDTSYECVGKSGKGSFGVVFQAKDMTTQKDVAIKRVLQDPRYKNRELQIMKTLEHTNCVALLDSFYDRKGSELYLNLVLEYVPKNLFEVSSSYSKKTTTNAFATYKIICVSNLPISFLYSFPWSVPQRH